MDDVGAPPAASSGDLLSALLSDFIFLDAFEHYNYIRPPFLFFSEIRFSDLC